MTIWQEWQCVFIREIRGLSLRRAVRVIADRELNDTEIETLGRAGLTIAYRDAYRVSKIQRVGKIEIKVKLKTKPTRDAAKIVQAKMF